MIEENKALQLEVGAYLTESRVKDSKIKDLLVRIEANSKVIENLSTEKAEDKIKQKEENQQNETNIIEMINTFEENLTKSATDIEYWKRRSKQNELATDRLKQELEKSVTEKNELKRLLSEKDEIINSLNKKLNRKDQNLKILLNEIEIHKSRTK